MGGGQSPRLSLCVIARNEAATLATCLASVRSVADDIVVVDTGSQDQTAAIAAAHGARVLHYAWHDDFAAARNAALEAARAPWVLSLDADEVMPAPTAAQLPAVLADARAPALRLPIENVAATGGLGSIELRVRLFRRQEGHRWTGIVAEQLTATYVADASLPIVHHGWSDASRRTAKLQRNLGLLERALAATPDHARLLAHRADVELALGYAEAAVATAERALALPDAQGETGLLLLDTLAQARAAAGRLEAAADVCRIALALRPEWIDPRLLLAQLARYAGRPREAAMHLERWLADRARLASDPAWPARLPRLRTLGAETSVRAELAMVAAGLGELDRGRQDAGPGRFAAFALGSRRLWPAGARGLA